MPKQSRDRVAMVHPSGRPTVFVSPSRAATLRERGYTASGAAGAATLGGEPVKLDRAVLSARAKALGVPVKGTNEALAAAISAAEHASVPNASSAGEGEGEGGTDGNGD